VLSCALFAGVARAGAPTAPTEARLLSADPNAPVTSLMWRWGLRALLAADLQLLDPDQARGFSLAFCGFVDLHNASPTSFVPYQFWRGRIWLEPGYRAIARIAPRPIVLVLSLPIEHESDHPTDGSGHGFVYLNSVGLRARVTFAAATLNWTFAATTRAHVFDCTYDPSKCAGDGGVGMNGSAVFEQDVEATLDGGMGPRTQWRYFTSVFGSWMPGRELVNTERRVSVLTGFWIRTEHRGMFQLVGTLVAGSELSLDRATASSVKAGLGLRWAY
jgi:hypothetical protein